MSALDNPLLRKSTRFGYYSALDENTVQDPVDPDPREGSGRYKEVVSRDLYGAGSMVGRQDYVVGEDGNYYNEDGERVYYWVRPRETDSTMRDYGTEEMSIGQDMGGYYTEAEIRGAWDADEGMGYFKEQTDWDNYWGYLTERQDMIQSGDLPDPTRPEYMDAFPAADVGEAPIPNVGSSFGGGRDEEIYYAREDAAGAEARNAAMAAFVGASSALMQKYGISPSFQNKDGDTFMFNGSTYVRTDKVDDSFDVAGFVGGLALSALTAGAAAFLAPALAGAIGVSNTVAKGLITAALDLAQGNDLDIGTALGLVGGDILPGGVTLDELGAADDAVQSAIDAVVDELTDPDNYREDDANNTIVWGGHGGTDEMGNPIVNIPDFTTTDETEEGGSTDAASDSSSDASTDSSDSSDSSDASGADSSADNGVGGDADDQSGDILGRQIHEAILKETDPEVRDRLIREWEIWTGEVWDEGYYDDKPFDPDQEREPIGHIWIPGDGVEGGIWWPIYNESDIPADGTFVRGSTKPTTPPQDSTEGTTDAGVTDGTTGEPVPEKGTAMGEECLPNGDKEIYTADGEGGVDTEVVPQGCVEGGGTGGGLLSGGDSGGSSGGDSVEQMCSNPRPEEYGFDQIYWDKYCGQDSSDSGGDQSGSDSGGDQTGSTDGGGSSGGDSVDAMCSNPRPEEYGFAQINWDRYCGDGQGSGTGDGTGDGSGDGDGTGDGDGGDMSGLMSGSAGGSPTWGSLFGYTTLTPYQKRTLAPYVDYIKQAKGMLS